MHAERSYHSGVDKLQRRGESVVQNVLGATLSELSRVGYATLRIEDVAQRAVVNKTTIYRRWPTKPDLVRAALLSLSESMVEQPIPDTGSVRADLLELIRRTEAFTRTAVGRAIVRLISAESPRSELGRIAESARQRHDAAPLAILKRAQRRGELRKDLDTELLFEVLRSTCAQQMLQKGRLGRAFVGQLVDLLLRGGLAASPPSRPPSRAVARVKKA